LSCERSTTRPSTSYVILLPPGPASSPSTRRLTGPSTGAGDLESRGTLLSNPRGITGKMTMKIMSSTSRTSISGVTLISDCCEEFEAEKATAAPHSEMRSRRALILSALKKNDGPARTALESQLQALRHLSGHTCSSERRKSHSQVESGPSVIQPASATSERFSVLLPPVV